MSQKYQVNAHSVKVSRIANVKPLMAQGGMMSPDAGVTLALEGGVTHKWILEKESMVPSVGDYFVVDDELHTTFIVPAQKFAELFSVMAA